MCRHPGQALFLANARPAPRRHLLKLGKLRRHFGTPPFILGTPRLPLCLPFRPLVRPVRLGRQIGEKLAQLARQVRPRVRRCLLDAFGKDLGQGCERALCSQV
jgi:hypothetical protein